MALMFKSQSSFTITVGEGKTWDGTLQYSVDDINYSNFSSSVLSATSSLSGQNYVLYIRGIGNTVITGLSSVGWKLSASNDIECLGNVEEILDYQTVNNGNHPTMGRYTFQGMFKGWNKLITAPTLGATITTIGCYQSMFATCSSLKCPPALPATVLAANCYNSMFMGCDLLEYLPNLPATLLETNCYTMMFAMCSNVSLSSTQSAAYSREYRIPNTGTGTIAANAMKNMFMMTEGDITTPQINTTYYIKSLAYVEITSQPQSQEATTQAEVQPLSVTVSSSFETPTYQWYKKVNNSWTAISGATSTTYTPTLTSEVQYFKFVATGDSEHIAESNVAALHNSSGNYLTFSSSSSFYLPLMWQSNTYGKLQYSTDTIHWTDWNGEYINATLSSSTYKVYLRGKLEGLNSDNDMTGGIDIASAIPVSCSGNIETLLDWEKVAEHQAITLVSSQFYQFFKDQTCLISAPTLPATTLTYQCYYEMFMGCNSLTVAPDLPATTLATSCYEEMFKGCSSLLVPPALSANQMQSYCYAYMFQDCVNIICAPDLLSTNLASYCYYKMFSGCTSMMVLPFLSATTLAQGCYQYMFEGCSNIGLYTTSTTEHCVAYRVPYEGTGTDATDALANMFLNVAGDVTTPVINTTYYTNTIILITQQPQSQTVTDPEDVVAKTVIATAYVGTLTYQWQSSLDGIVWANISGATSNTYLPTAVLGTKYYRCELEVANIQTLYTNSCYLSYYNEDFNLLVRNRTQNDVDYAIELKYKVATDNAMTAEKARWDAATLKGTYNYTDLNRVGRMLNFLQYLCPSGTITYPYPLKWDWVENVQPTPTQMSQYLANIQAVKTAYPQTTVNVPAAINTFGNANDIEQLLYEIRDLV